MECFVLQWKTNSQGCPACNRVEISERVQIRCTCCIWRKQLLETTAIFKRHKKNRVALIYLFFCFYFVLFCSLACLMYFTTVGGSVRLQLLLRAAQKKKYTHKEEEPETRVPFKLPLPHPSRAVSHVTSSGWKNFSLPSAQNQRSWGRDTAVLLISARTSSGN